MSTDDDDDMGTIFRELREEKRLKRVSNHSENVPNIPMLHDLGLKVQKKSEYHYHVMMPDYVVNYYPSSNKWVIGTKTYHGNFKSFYNFLRKRLPPTEKSDDQ